MASNPYGSKYLHQTAVLKELARPSSERAIPSTEEPDMAYAEGRSKADAEGAQLAEQERRFMSSLLAAHDQLRIFSKQNDLATLIGVGNIAAQGVAGYQQHKAMAEQNETLRDIAATFAKLPGIVAAANAENRKAWEASAPNGRAPEPAAPANPDLLRFGPAQLPPEYSAVPPAPVTLSGLSAGEVLNPSPPPPRPSLAAISGGGLFRPDLFLQKGR